MTIARVPLPPLPRLAHDAFWEPYGRSVVDLLAGEHRRLGGLCAWLAGARTPARRREIADVVTATVVRHLSAEEQYVYPSVRAVLPDGDALAERELDRDRALLRALSDLAGAEPGDPTFGRLVRAAAGLLDEHVRVADLMLPRLRTEVADADLVRLGNRVELAQE
ncbi:MAG TPA: hemerythrin domain-containing protein, partial [Micromonosporaceae bacterium]|nr:hemerythrin domain-containing protein [Micromonosporaceae bacterium]